MKTILLKLAAPLQSWGTSSHYENRETDPFPSKSGIIGLVAASLGYRRSEDKKLAKLKQLSFAVRIDQVGTITKDFQIATSYKPNGDKNRGYVTNRFYLQDAVFVVAIGSKDDELIEKILFGLKNPYFQLYLGRRASAINYDYLLSVESGDLIDNLKSYPWQAADWYKKKNDSLVDIWADQGLLEKNSYYKMIRDVPESFTQGKTDTSIYDRRTYQLRNVGYLHKERIGS